MAVNQYRNDALRRDPCDTGHCRELIRQIGRQGRVGRLHGQQARGYVDQGVAWDDEQIGAHPRQASSDPIRQCPAGDKSGKPDTDAEHDRHGKQNCAQPAALDILRRQPDQQPTILPAPRHFFPELCADFTALARGGS